MADVGGVGVADYVPTTLSSVQRVSARVAQYQSGSGVVAGIWTPTSPFNAPYPAGGGFSGDPRVLQNYNSIWDGSGSPPSAPGDMLGLWTRQAGDSNWIQDVSGNRMEMAVHPLGGITQLFQYSDDFSNAVWVPTAATKSGRTFTVDGTTATHPVQQNFAVTAGITYTYTIDFESTDYQYAGLGLNSATFFGNTSLCYFNLTNATIVVKPAYYTSASIVQVSANRWRLQVTGPCISSGTTQGIRIYPAISTDGGATATASFNGTTYPGSYTLYKAHFQMGSTETTYQESTTLSNVTQEGQPSIYMPRSGGSGFFKFPAVGFGTATSGMFADTGVNAHVVTLVRSIAAGTSVAQCGSTDANMMFLDFIGSNGNQQTRVRGTLNDSGVSLTDGKFHVVHHDIANGVMTRRIDSSARTTLTAGAAAAETQVLTTAAHNAATPASILTGRVIAWAEDRNWTEAEEQQCTAWLRANISRDIP